MHWKKGIDVHTCTCAQTLSRVRLFATPWTVALCPWNVSGKNTGAGFRFLLQGIFLTQELPLHLLPWQVESLSLCCLGSPAYIHCMYKVAN